MGVAHQILLFQNFTSKIDNRSFLHLFTWKYLPLNGWNGNGQGPPISSKEFFYAKQEGYVMFWLMTPTVHVITLQCEEFEKKMQYENPMNGLKKTKIGYTNTVYSETCAIWQNLSYKQFLLQFITKGKSFS